MHLFLQKKGITHAYVVLQLNLFAKINVKK